MANQDENNSDYDNEVAGFQATKSELGNNSISNLNKKDLNKKLKIATSILCVIVLAVVSIVFYNRAKSEKELEASAALSRIRTVFDSGDYNKAITGDATKLIRDTPLVGLKEIVDQYGSSENGKVAALYAGNSLIYLKKHEEAIEYLEKALNSNSNEVKVGANIGLAICKEFKNDYSEAAGLYYNAAVLIVQNAAKDKYKLYAALNFEKANNREKAEKIFREILNGESMEYIAESKSGLTRLGMIVE